MKINTQFWQEKGRKRADLARQSERDLAREWKKEERPSLAWAIRNDASLARKADAGIRKLHEALITNPRDEVASAQYQERLNAWCKEKFDLTLEWLEKSKQAARWDLFLKRFVILVVLSVIIGGTLVGMKTYNKNKIKSFIDKASYAQLPKQAIENYRNAMALGDTTFETYDKLADAYILVQEQDCAIKLFENFRKKDPNHIEATFKLASIYSKHGKTGKANELYELILTKDEKPQTKAKENTSSGNVKPRAIIGKLELASLALNAGDYDSSLDLHNEVLKWDSENQKAFLGLEAVYFRKGDFKASRDNYKKIKEDKGAQAADKTGQDNYIKAQLCLGEIYTYQGGYEKAVEHYEKVLKGYPDYLDAHIGLFSVYLRQIKWHLAELQYDTIIAICLNQNSLPSQVRMNIATLFLNKNDFRKAIVQYEKILKEDNAINRLGVLLGLGTA